MGHPEQADLAALRSRAVRGSDLSREEASASEASVRGDEDHVK